MFYILLLIYVLPVLLLAAIVVRLVLMLLRLSIKLIGWIVPAVLKCFWRSIHWLWQFSVKLYQKHKANAIQ